MTHEEMLDLAAQRESMNVQKRKIEKQFDAWFNELVGFSFRSEWFDDDFDYAKESKDNQIMVKWLRTAFEMGFYACESKINGESK